MNPYTGEPVGAPIPHTPPDAPRRGWRGAAAAAAAGYAAMPLPERAALLRAVAAALEAARDELVALADAETGLGAARLGGELTRSPGPVRAVRRRWSTTAAFLDAVIDHADPDALPAPRPDLRRMLVPIGPVAVFAASNFPFAFSVAGGDTASALAAGCPVVVKAHPGHPGLSARCGDVIAAALARHGAPGGTFARRVRPRGRPVAGDAPGDRGGRVHRVGAGGRALFDLAAGRPDPIPFYGELGSLNPTVVTPGAVADRGAADRGRVRGLVHAGHRTVLHQARPAVPAGRAWPGGRAGVRGRRRHGRTVAQRAHPRRLSRGVAELAATPGVRALAPGSTVEVTGYAVAPTLFAVAAPDWPSAADAC